jgi:hypothetical protein
MEKRVIDWIIDSRGRTFRILDRPLTNVSESKGRISAGLSLIERAKYTSVDGVDTMDFFIRTAINSPRSIIYLFDRIGLDHYTGSMDEFIDFLYYYIYGRLGYMNVPNEIYSLVSGLSIQQLSSILSQFNVNLNIPTRSALTYTVLSGYIPIYFTKYTLDMRRYSIISSIHIGILSDMMRMYPENIIASTFLGPYTKYASLPKRSLEDYILFLIQNGNSDNRENIADTIIQKLGLSLIGRKGDIFNNVFDYIIDEARYIYPTLERPIDMRDPPDLTGATVSQDDIFKFLTYYTEEELLRFYNISPTTTDNKPSLIRRIINKYSLVNS